MFDFRDPSTPRTLPSVVDLNPLKFYSLIDLARSASEPEELATLDRLIKDVSNLCEEVNHSVEELAQINNNLLSEVRNTTRRKSNPFRTDQEAANDFTDLRHTVSGRTFMHVIFNVATTIQLAFHELKNATEAARPGKFLVVGKRLAEVPESIEQLHAFSVQFEMNRVALNRFTQGVRYVPGTALAGQLQDGADASRPAWLSPKDLLGGIQIDLGRAFPPMSYVYLFYRVDPGHVFYAVVEPIGDKSTP